MQIISTTPALRAFLFGDLMLPYLTWATIVFAAALVLVEWQDSRGNDLTKRPISYYFKTATSVVQSTMFAVMAAALWATAWPMGLG